MYAKRLRLRMCLAALSMFLMAGLAGCGDGGKTDGDGASGRPGDGAASILGPREAARRAIRENDLKQIALAMNSYQMRRGRFPPAAQRGGNGEPLLSWRVLLLPHLDHEGLYEQFRLDEPWDSEHNRKLIDQIPSVYAGGRTDGKTSVMVFVGRGAPFGEGRGPSSDDFTDGQSNTILCVEAGPDVAVPWTKPEDLGVDPNDPVAVLGDLPRGEILTVFFDGRIFRFASDIDAKVLAALINPADGERVEPGNHEIKSR